MTSLKHFGSQPEATLITRNVPDDRSIQRDDILTILLRMLLVGVSPTSIRTLWQIRRDAFDCKSCPRPRRIHSSGFCLLRGCAVLHRDRAGNAVGCGRMAGFLDH